MCISLQIETNEIIPDAKSVILRCENGYAPVGHLQSYKTKRFKEDKIVCKNGTWSKPMECEAGINLVS